MTSQERELLLQTAIAVQSLLEGWVQTGLLLGYPHTIAYCNEDAIHLQQLASAISAVKHQQEDN